MTTIEALRLAKGLIEVLWEMTDDADEEFEVEYDRAMIAIEKALAEPKECSLCGGYEEVAGWSGPDESPYEIQVPCPYCRAATIPEPAAEPKQEPVAHVALHRVGLEFGSLDNYCINAHCDLEVGQPLYLAPQPDPALVAAVREALSEFYFGDCDEPVLCRKMDALRKALPRE